MFQYTAARRRLLRTFRNTAKAECFNTQPPEGGCRHVFSSELQDAVSIHSRPKAAETPRRASDNIQCFNTQPPEGGCDEPPPPEEPPPVSIHSRPKAAGKIFFRRPFTLVSIHSRPKAAAVFPVTARPRTLFQYTAARRRLSTKPPPYAGQGRFNTQPPEGGCRCARRITNLPLGFQYTAARRRLLYLFVLLIHLSCFNTQPPEGG